VRNRVTGKWRKLHREELHDLGRVCGTMEWEGVYNVLVTKHEEKKPLGRPRHRWVDNIKLDLKKLC